ncbi:TonB-dependent receptor [Formosa sp. Hel3_A1_48]|uniref:TonB-dependent receptor n=1 Tax=Formosa sp. Hel3_A1_48 TaxID=1336795 RepID=UPI00084E37AC|nr:TonB-dependent receptor [Formosa sp. Hel3_A1_48]AOR26075.1 TonB-dependent receptor [Formosa sp. Hel3_A1_48]MDC0950496.1 TonB-dependent receptor [Flavobacteriaceae bacterium]
MKNYILYLAFILVVPLWAQEAQPQDSTQTQNLDEVLVKAVRVQPNAPITHSNLTKKDIRKRNLGQDIPVLLNYLPSVVSSSDAGTGIGYTYLRVRGSDATRVNVTINGIPYNDAESQGTFWVNLGDFASSVESLQLQRGVGTSTNGSGAFGASLNILTDGISENAGGEIANSFGSFGTRKHSIKFTTGLLNDHFEFAGRLSKIYSDGYVDRAFTDLKSYYLQGNYVDKNTIVKAIAFGGKEKTYQAWYGLSKDQLEEDRTQNPYTYDNETDNYWQDHYQLHWIETLNANWSTNIGLNYTRGKGYFEQFKDGRSAADYNNLINEDSDVVVRRWLDNHFYVANANVTYKKNSLELITGISYSDYTNDHYGEIIWGSDLASETNIRDRYYLSISDKSDFSIFSKATFRMSEKLQAFLDIQGRFVNYTTTGLTSDRAPIDIDERFDFFNPKLGFTYTLNPGNSLYVSYARANKEPNRNDFESNAVDVQHEELNDFELGWRHESDRLRLNANVYYMQYNNQLVLSGALDNVGEYLRENVDKSYRLGLELDVSIVLTEQLSLVSNFALSKNKIQDLTINRDGAVQNLNDTNIAFSPDLITTHALEYAPNTKFRAALIGKYVGEQYLSNTDTEASKLDSYFVTDFNFTYTLPVNNVFDSIVFTGMVNNLFDLEYVDRGFTYLDTWSGPTATEIQGYYPQATRNFLLGMTLMF